MPQEQQPASQSQPLDTTKESPLKEEVQKSTETKDAATQTQTKDNPECRHPNIVVNIPPSDESRTIKAMNRANLLSGIASVVNMGILIATFFILFASVKSVDIAQRALTQAAIADDSTHNLNREEFELNKATLDIQIKALEETNKQFMIGNEPFLQLINIKLENFQIAKRPITHFQIVNVGNYPVKVISARYMAMIRISPPNFKEMDKPSFKATNVVNKIIAKEQVSNYYQLAPEMGLPTQLYNEVIEGKSHYYLLGQFTYLNLINKSTKSYKFILQMRPTQSGTIVNFLKNDND